MDVVISEGIEPAYFSLPPLPLVSIIVTNHNYGRFLEQCVKSVYAQTYTEFECIVVDDASTDDSLQQLELLKQQFTNLVVIASRTNLQHLPAGREGFQHAKGELIVFLDADDYLHPDFLRYHVAAHLAAIEPVSFTSCNSSVVSPDENGEFRLVSSGFFLERKASTERDIYRRLFDDLPDLVKNAMPDLLLASHFIDITEAEWPWAATSAMMFRRRGVALFIDVEDATYSLDAYLCRGLNPITGSILFDLSLSYYRRHGENIFLRETKLRNTVQFNLDHWMPREALINKKILAHICREEARFRSLFFDQWGYVNLVRRVSTYYGVNTSLSAIEAESTALPSPQRWPVISFVVVNRNYGRFIRTCIETIYKQSYRFFECIVVDDASSDNSHEVLDRLEQEFQGLIVIRRPCNEGQLDACRIGLDRAKGAFVAFIDADDFLANEFAATHIWAHMTSPISVGFTSGEMWEISGETITASSVLVEGWRDHGLVQKFQPRHLPRPVPATNNSIVHDAPDVYMVAKTCTDWLWAPTSGSVYKTTGVKLLMSERPHFADFRVGADAYLNYAMNALSGSLIIDRPLGSYRVHKTNNFTQRTRLSGQLAYRKDTDPAPFAALAALDQILSHFELFWSQFDTRTLARAMATLLRKATHRRSTILDMFMMGAIKLFFGAQAARQKRLLLRNKALLTYLSIEKPRADGASPPPEN